MKISVCGKGGSGKSTIVALLAKEARDRGYRVLVVDSDESNTGLFRMFSFNNAPVPLMELVGGKRSLQRKMGQPNILKGTSIKTSQIPEGYWMGKDGLMLVSIGKILQSLEGCACPMGVLSREFLKKLDLQEDEIAIIDMEAGVEHFGRGVETSVDSVLIVVEPSLESIEVAKKINDLAKGIGISNIWAVLNKMASDDIATKVNGALKRHGIHVVGRLNFDTGLFESSIDGKILAEGKVVEDIREVLDSILSQVTK